MSEETLQRTIGLAVAAIVVVIVAVMYQEVESATKLARLCAERAGENYTYVTGSQSFENTTIACKAPNGTRTRVSSVVNATSGL